MDPNGTVTVTLGLTTQGQGNRTTAAQVAADLMGVRPEDVTVIAGDSTRHTYGSGTVASRGAVIASGAIGRAAGEPGAPRAGSDLYRLHAEYMPG